MEKEEIEKLAKEYSDSLKMTNFKDLGNVFLQAQYGFEKGFEEATSQHEQTISDLESELNDNGKVILSLHEDLNVLTKERDELKKENEITLRSYEHGCNLTLRLQQQIDRYRKYLERIVNFKNQDLDVYQLQKLAKNLLSTPSKEEGKTGCCSQKCIIECQKFNDCKHPAPPEPSINKEAVCNCIDGYYLDNGGYKQICRNPNCTNPK